MLITSTIILIFSPAILQLRTTHSGSLLLEAILAIAVFSIFLGGIGFSLLFGERTTIAGGDRARAAFLAEQQLEGVRQMRTESFSSVTVGTHGVQLTPTGWSLSGSSAVTPDGFRTSVTVNQQGTDWLQVQANVGWNFGGTRSGSLVLYTYFTDWDRTATVGDWSLIHSIGQAVSGVTPEYQNILVTGNFAFVTSDRSQGGNGLYVFDISAATPVRVAGTFDLGASAYGLAVSGDRLYLATNDPAMEIQVFDIASPGTLSESSLIKSYDLPGSGGARVVALYGKNIFVGTLFGSPHDEFYALEMSETGPIALSDSLSIGGSVQGISLQDGYAYIATSDDAGELKVIDIYNPEQLDFAPGIGMDITDVQDGSTVLVSGTAALLGRVSGSTIDELTLFDVAASPVPSPPPGPWSMDIAGDARSLTSIYGSRYGFVGGNGSASELRVLDLKRFAQNQNPVLVTVNVGATVRGLHYDWQRDQLYAVTPDSIIVYAP